MAINKDSKIQFKHGSQDNLFKLMGNSASIEVGTFYLTNDTHRLYLGVSENNTKKIVAVNEGIVKYTATDFPPASSCMGQFAYIEGTGILCVSNGKEWFQINPDTNTTYTFDEVAATVDGDDSTSATITITANAKTTKDSSTAIGPQSGSIVKEEITFTFTGSNGIVVEGNESTITVTGPTIKTKTLTDESGFDIRLEDKNGTLSSDVHFKTNANLRAKLDDDGETIWLNAKDTTLKSGNLEGGKALEKGFEITAIDTDNNRSGGQIDPIIAYGKVDDKTQKPSKSVHFVNGTATLDVYTKAEIDNIQLKFNAMNYKGVVDTLPSATDNLQIGDTFKVAAKILITNDKDEVVTAQIGDIIIADGTEGLDGNITEETLKWDVVPSGNEDTTYYFESIASTTSTGDNSYGIQLMEKPLGGSPAAIGSLAVIGGEKLTATMSEDQGNVEITVNHDKLDCKETLLEPSISNVASNVIDTYGVGVAKTYSTVQDIEVDKYGHVTEFKYQNVTIGNTNAKLEEKMGVDVETSGTGAKITLTTTLDRTGDKTNKASGAFSIKSDNDNLTIAANNTSDTVTLGFVWGEFPVIS